MKEIVIHLERCLGCKTCELACAVEHSGSKALFSTISETVPPLTRVYVEAGEEYNFPLQCRHCADAYCVKACISGALSQDKQSGLINQDRDKCVGCWMCVMTCPFGVIMQDRQGRVALKCDRCPDLDTPACVSSCPTEAIKLQELTEYTRKKRKDYLTNFSEQ